VEDAGSIPARGANLFGGSSSEKERRISAPTVHKDGQLVSEAAGSIPAFPTNIRAGSSDAERPFGGDDASQASPPTICGSGSSGAERHRQSGDAASQAALNPTVNGGSPQGALVGSIPAPSTTPDISGTHAYALGCRDEKHLLEISDLLTRNEFQHIIIREPDAPFNGAAMAIGCLPTTRSKLRKLLRDLPLLGSKTEPTTKMEGDDAGLQFEGGCI
jgi:hypothetical protein